MNIKLFHSNLAIYRAKFSEITKVAVERALQRLFTVDENVVKAVDCRMELDLRIGLLQI
jgi:DNA topoisomerase-3